MKTERAHVVSNAVASLHSGAQTSFAGAGVRPPRQDTLAALRWTALTGQSIALVVAVFLLDIRLPLGPCILAILAGVAFNLASNTYRGGPRRRLSEEDAFLSLLFDLAQLVALLFLTGGLENPFALFLLAPVTISALTLSIKPTIVLGLFSIAAATLLGLDHVPLVDNDNQPLNVSMVTAGFWTAIAIGAGFQAVFARRIAADNHAMNMALTATQMALEREQRLSAIGAMAAAAAHELGTPLATIKVAAAELRRELQQMDLDQPELVEDAELIAEQAARCREILTKLQRLKKEPHDEELETAPITAVIEEAAAPHLGRGVEITMRVDGTPAPFAALDTDGLPMPPQPKATRRPEIIQGLRNLVQNAVDFADRRVWIDIDVEDASVTVRISDDGPGFPAEILQRLGDPYNSSRARPGAAAEEGYVGMGLGVFISKTLLERTGAEISFANGRHGGAGAKGGAVVEVRWPTKEQEIRA